MGYEFDKINGRFEYLREYCSDMDRKYNNDKITMDFTNTSVSELIDKETSDKIVDKLQKMIVSINTLNDKITKSRDFSRDSNNASLSKMDNRTPDQRKQHDMICDWVVKSKDYVMETSNVVYGMKNMLCSNHLRVPLEFFVTTQKSRNQTQNPKNP